MRFYALGNQYLSSIQQGIQAFHCLGEMVSDRGAENAIVDEWLHNHKTLVCLNGGNNSKLWEMYDFLNSRNNPYPFAIFHEDNASLGGLLTCVGIIVPEKIYAADEFDLQGFPMDSPKLTPYEIELATRLKKMPTAR